MLRLLAVLCLGLAAAADPTSEAQALLQRVLPKGRDAEFTVTIDAAAGDTFTIADGSKAGTVALTGNTAGSVAAALNWYLKYVAFCQMSWAGDNMKLASPLPKVGKTITQTRNYKYGYMANVCTVSYTQAWWRWPRWERELDWMAMNGINMPLAFTGQEYVWNATYTQLGLTFEDLQDFFAGPAFLAWQRMGNIQGWGGPLPADFITAQKDLQVQILQRARALGMTPVLPAFAGFVPPALVEKRPGLKVRGAGVWNGFEAQYGNVSVLDPTDVLFNQIATIFIKEQTKVYGTDHFYAADQFNELDPSSADAAYLGNASHALFQGLRNADEKATWVMQGWLFLSKFWSADRIQAYLGGVPNDGMLILDLTSENVPQYTRTNSYYGKPFIWNMLLNYGGNTGFYGEAGVINTVPHADMTNTTIVGFGITPEGTMQNYPIFDLMLENMWRKKPVDMKQWWKDYAHRRYGQDVDGVAQVWQLIGDSAFALPAGGQMGATKNKMVLRPQVQMDRSGFMPTNIAYNTSSIVNAMKALLQDGSSFAGSDTYAHDIVDVTRQALSNVFYDIQNKAVAAYNKSDTAALYRFANESLDMMNDMDNLLSSHSGFLLGNWLEAAKTWGGDDTAAQAYYEFNARNQITLWGPNGEINDYAAKEWGGLVKAYYVPRWQLFWQQLGAASAAKKPFDNAKFAQDCLALEQSWQHKNDTFPTAPKGSPLSVAVLIASKYFPDV